MGNKVTYKAFYELLKMVALQIVHFHSSDFERILVPHMFSKICFTKADEAP